MSDNKDIPWLTAEYAEKLIAEHDERLGAILERLSHPMPEGTTSIKIHRPESRGASND